MTVTSKGLHRRVGVWLLAGAVCALSVADATAQRFPQGGPSAGGMRGGEGFSRPGRGPGWGGVATGIGVGVATGILLGTAAANPPPRVYFEDDEPRGPRRPRPPQARPQRPPPPSASVSVPPAGESRFVTDEVLLELSRTVSPAALIALAARHRLTILEQQPLALTGTILVRARIADGRAIRAVLNGLRSEGALRATQPNYLYTLAQQADPQADEAASRTGDPAQYVLAKLRLPEAHALARGQGVLVALIDSAIDADHPELKDVIAEHFDALGGDGPAHAHGTAMAGAIAARSRLMGTAPAARLIAIRAFGSGANAQATSYAVIRGVDHAASRQAKVLNMSFAGPSDAALSRQLAAARARGMVLIAAAGNAGPKSAPLYPAADPNVIAVSATDAADGAFGPANRGRHIAVSAPGVGILVAAPQAGYQMNSGTSVAAAHVSGVVALVLERKPGLTPDALRQVLLGSARDLGPRGRDDQFGAGLADAYQALQALEPKTAAAGR